MADQEENIDLEAIKSLLRENTTDLSENIEIDIPLIGKKKVSELVQYLPWYIKFRGDLKGLVPKSYDDMIMKYAAEKGYAKPKRQNIEDIDMPLRDLEDEIETLDQRGYSPGQIAKLLNIQPMLVSGYFTKRRLAEEEEYEAALEKVAEEDEKAQKSISTLRYKVKAWLLKRLL